MTMDDTDDIEDEYEPTRLTVWVVLAIMWQFWRNTFNAHVVFWEDMSQAFLNHANWKNEKKTFADSVMADISKL